MCLEKSSPFTKMLVGVLIGIVLGIIFGLLVGLLMAWISMSFNTLSAAKSTSLREQNFYQMASFLGMGAGAIVGAILSGIAFMHKK